ncbi:MAG: IclR family transcriptional regulator [Rhodospirillales bacterium]|nr:IclR family transcriptional regulator [Rhodospirillales bacterium]
MSIRSIDRALSILETFEPNQPLLTLHEISVKVKLPKTTTFRILQTLIDSGYILHTDNTHFELSMKTLRLGDCVRIDPEMARLARPELEFISKEVNETVALSALIGDSRVIIDFIESTEILKIAIRRGEQNDRNTGATGRVFLAYHPNHFNEYLKTQPKDKAKIREDVDHVLKHGYVMTTNQRTEGLVGIAVPLFNIKDECSHSLGIFGPTGRIAPNADKFAQLLITSADRISTRAGSRRLIKQPT